MFDWLKRLFHRRRDDGSWPRHLFIHIDGRGLAWAGEVADQVEVDVRVNDIVCDHIEKTGDVTFAQSWTTKEELFSKRERKAFRAGVCATEGVSDGERG